MADVFVSYSRKDLEFVQQLVDGLKLSGKNPWFDQLKEPLSGIAAGAPWWEQIKIGIESVDNFLFVITPNAISSPYCQAEISYARAHGKRLVPVLYCGLIGEGETRKAIDASIEAIADDEEIPNTVTAGILNLKKLVRANWLAISEIQYVTFASSIAFEQSLEQLVQALDLDLAWVRMHSQLMQAAKLWEANGFDDDYLWGASRLKSVYEMIERRKPELESLIQAFIRPEADRLLEEIKMRQTPHHRRSAIGERLSVIGDSRTGIGVDSNRLPQIDWFPVASGGKITIENQTFTIEPFYIAKHLITYSQFQAFADDENVYRDEHWWEGMPKEYRRQIMDDQFNKYSNYPRDSISWYQAVAFTRWLTYQYKFSGLLPARLASIEESGGKLQRLLGNLRSSENDEWVIRLPTEWEWLWAFRNGKEGRIYPWGDDWMAGRNCNTAESGIGRAIAVGMYPDGAAACGALDMVGNLWEWCINDEKAIRKISLDNGQSKVKRGAAFNNQKSFAASSYRAFDLPFNRVTNSGFRVVAGSAIHTM